MLQRYPLLHHPADILHSRSKECNQTEIFLSCSYRPKLVSHVHVIIAKIILKYVLFWSTLSFIDVLEINKVQRTSIHLYHSAPTCIAILCTHIWIFLFLQTVLCVETTYTLFFHLNQFVMQALPSWSCLGKIGL